MVVILVLVVTFYVFGSLFVGDCREEGEEKWRCDLVCEVYCGHVVVVFVDTCCCCVGVDCGELMEPRVARIELGVKLADWSMYGGGVVWLELVVGCCVLVVCDVVVIMRCPWRDLWEFWVIVAESQGGWPRAWSWLGYCFVALCMVDMLCVVWSSRGAHCGIRMH